MLATLLLSGLVAAPLTSAALFAPTPPPRRVRGVLPAGRRLVLALIGTGLVGVVVYAALGVLGVSTPHRQVAALAPVAVSLLWLPMTRRWNARAHLAWACSVLL